jgi:hypothetical protein
MATSAKTEEYDGTTWTDGNDMVAGKSAHTVTGTQTAAIAIGGDGTKTNCQEYDGTSWTTGGSLSGAGRNAHEAFGTLATAITMGGHGILATAEQYDGSSWSAIDDMPAGRKIFATFGSAEAGIAAGGQIVSDGDTNITYKYTDAVTARTLSNS